MGPGDLAGEVGASGRSWDRVSMVALLDDPPAPQLVIDDVRVEHVAPTVALLTYRTSEPSGSAARVSVWVLTAAGWRLRYHQGTPVTAPHREPV